jgi:BA14K-like protein
MKRIVKVIGATVLALTVSGAAVGPSLAAGHWIPHSHAGVRGGHFGHFHRGYSGWSGGSYYNPGFYGYGYDYGYDPGAAIVGGLVGGVFGALADRAFVGGGSHVARCERAYRTYSPASNTFVGNDGLRHACRL